MHALKLEHLKTKACLSHLFAQLYNQYSQFIIIDGFVMLLKKRLYLLIEESEYQYHDGRSRPMGH